MDKLHVIVRADLSPGQRAVQACHAAIQFMMEHRELGQRWFEESNYLALLTVPDERQLRELVERAETVGVEHSVFLEPDLGSSLTALALEPGRRGMKVCRHLSLAETE